ncbi:MAG TPA: helix-turn-helix transcriptional regulator [Conexibacter sp.]|nr:helix-turn-helix transcriptional regulator [Conexibacter sp.]
MDLTGDVIRETRERHGLSQRRLALRAGTTQAVVSRIERGVASPTVETQRRLLAAMGWELDVVLRRSRWQDHDPAALRSFGAQDPSTRLAGIERTIGDVAALRGAASRAGRSP